MVREEEHSGILMCPNLNKNNGSIITVATCSVLSQKGWSVWREGGDTLLD